MKRLSAIQGDHGFHASHRSAFSKFAATQDVWSLCSCPCVYMTGLRVLIWDLPHIVWKRRKDLLYLGSFHSCELPEFYGLTGDHVGTDALSMYTLPSPSLVPVADENYIS